jgi:hypothetical protein
MKSDEGTNGSWKRFLCTKILDAGFWAQRPTEIARVDQDFWAKRYLSLLKQVYRQCKLILRRDTGCSPGIKFTITHKP